MERATEIIQLEDLLSSYGSSIEPHFQRKISGLQEFTSLASEIKESPPKKGEYYKHQRFTHRYLEHFDNLLVLSETGTGKTCEIVGFLEMARDYFNKQDKDIGIDKEGIAHFKKMYIFVKNGTLKKELRKQIVCSCTDGRYITEQLLKVTTESGQKGSVTSILKAAGYVIMTYATASNEISKLLVNPVTGEQIYNLDDPKVTKELHEMFDDSIIWFDEAHNLVSEIEGEQKPKPKPGKGNPPKEEIYRNMHHVLHLARRSKRILSTATPMINKVDELADLLNLILPANGQLPEDYNHTVIDKYERRAFFPELHSIPDEQFKTLSPAEIAPYFRGQFPPGFNFNTARLREVEPYFRGRINFVRSADTGANPIFNGFKVDAVHGVGDDAINSQVILFPSVMSEFQFDGYLRASAGEDGKSSKGGGGWRPNEQQATNMVFPDGTWGNGTREQQDTSIVANRPVIVGNQDVRIGGYRRYVDKSSPREEFRAAIGTANLLPRNVIIDNLRNFSSKYATFCELALQGEGICFAFDEKVTGSGILTLAACLECLGFQYFEGRNSIFVGENEGLKPYCSSTDKSTKRTIRPDFTPAPRFSILYQDTVEYSDRILEAMNCYENRHGDYVKILLCGKVAREGISVSNVRQIHILTSSWNQSNNLQALARGIRATSHVDLIEERRRLAQTEEERNNIKIDVLIFNHVSLPPYANVEEMMRSGVILKQDYLFERGDKTATMVDVALFLRSEGKDISIKRVMRKLKQSSVSCNVHRVRNQRLQLVPGSNKLRSADQNYSPTCDYQKCDYHCFDDPPETIDGSNYDLLYSGEIVKEVEHEILDYLKETNRFSFEELLIRTEGFYKPLYLAKALEKIVIRKEEILDRFGYINFLREDNGFFYLERSYPSLKPSRLMSHYTDGLIAVVPEPLAVIAKDADIEEGYVRLDELPYMDPYGEQFSRTLHAMPIASLAIILEDAIKRRMNGDNSPYVNRILDYFLYSVVYQFHRPQKKIDEAILSAAQSKRGRKAKNEPVAAPQHFKEKIGITQTDTPIVFIHNLDVAKTKLTNFNTVSNFNKGGGRLRIIESDNEVGWRDLNNAEFSVYNKLIQEEIMRRKQPYEELKIYGIVDFKNKMRIRDVNLDKTDKQDIREKAKGRECSNRNIPEIYEIFWTLRFYPNNIPVRQSQATLTDEYQRAGAYQKMFESAEEFWNNYERSNLLYAWFKEKKKKEELCEELRKFFKVTGRLQELFPW